MTIESTVGLFYILISSLLGTAGICYFAYIGFRVSLRTGVIHVRESEDGPITDQFRTIPLTWSDRPRGFPSDN